METKETVKQIRAVKPDRLDIYDRDMRVHPVVIEQLGRQKWQRLEEIIDGIPWVKIACLTSKGELLKPIHSDAGPARADDQVVEVDPVSDVERLTTIMLRVQEKAMAMQLPQIDRALTSLERMGQIMSDAMVTVRDSYELAMKLHATALAGAVDPDAGPDDQMQKFLGILMMLKGMPNPFGSAPPKTAPGPRPGPANGQSKPT